MTGFEYVRAVLDRFEGDLAVLLCEAGGEVVDELAVERTRLPEAGRHEGAVFDLAIDSSGSDGRALEAASYRPATTDRRTRDVQSRFDRLSERLGDDES